MFRIYGLEFHDFEDEKITPSSILACHPQRVKEEAYGIPLRVTVGYQCFYDKLHRLFAGVTFYAPPDIPNGVKVDKADPSGKPSEQFSFVLASFDGRLTPVNGEIVLSDGEKAIIYSDFLPTKTSGQVKKGAIIGSVGKIQNGYGYGVSIRGYKSGKIWDIQRELSNIPCIE